MPRTVSPELLAELVVEVAARRKALGPHPPASAAAPVAEVLWFENVIAETEGRGEQLAGSLFEWYEVVDRGWLPGTWCVVPPTPR